jgi:hypothetical protein
MPLLPFLFFVLNFDFVSGKEVIAKHMLFEGSTENFHASTAIVQFYFFILPVPSTRAEKEADRGRKKVC